MLTQMQFHEHPRVLMGLDPEARKVTVYTPQHEEKRLRQFSIATGADRKSSVRASIVSMDRTPGLL